MTDRLDAIVKLVDKLRAAADNADQRGFSGELYREAAEAIENNRTASQVLLADLTALRQRHAADIEAAWREGALMILDCPFTSEDLDRMWRQSEARRQLEEGR